jgi:hypothetical protein
MSFPFFHPVVLVYGQSSTSPSGYYLCEGNELRSVIRGILLPGYYVAEMWGANDDILN